MPDTPDMAGDPLTSDLPQRLLSGVKSDWLPQLHRLASRCPELAEIVEDYLRINLVIDANCVQQARAGVMVVDPDDLPYIAACEELAAHAVYSRDKHLRQMEAPVISVAIDASLQSYARANSVHLAAIVGSAFSVRLSLEAIRIVGAGLLKLYDGFRRLHPALQIAIVVALVYVFVNERLRTRLLNFLKGMGRTATPILGALTLAAEQFEISEVTLESAKKKIVAVVPVRQRIPVIARARRICVVSSQPVSLKELEKRVLSDGHRTNSAQFRIYLRRVLRTSGEFIETPAGWRLVAPAGSRTYECGPIQ